MKIYTPDEVIEYVRHFIETHEISEVTDDLMQELYVACLSLAQPTSQKLNITCHRTIRHFKKSKEEDCMISIEEILDKYGFYNDDHDMSVCDDFDVEYIIDGEIFEDLAERQTLPDVFNKIINEKISYWGHLRYTFTERRRFILNGVLDDVSTNELAKELNVTPNRIRELKKRALNQMRHPIIKRMIIDYYE